MDVTIIGVAGGTGSGKSTLVKRLQEAFKDDDVATLCHDYYYKAHPELTYEERTKLNYDHPQAFDTHMMVEHIRALKNNVPISHPVYSFVEHDRLPETVAVKPSKVIIVDGILIFENKALRELMDIKVYVDTDADVRLASMNAAGRWSRSSISISPPSSRCTRSSSNRRRSMPTSSFPKADSTRWPWPCSFRISGH